MGEIIDPTWLAFSSAEPLEQSRIEQGLERVGAHYGRLTAGGLSRKDSFNRQSGLVSWRDAEALGAWPAHTARNGRAMVSGYVPTGWQRLVGGVAPAEAANALMDMLLADPQTVGSSVDAPAVLAGIDLERDRLVICVDSLGAGRLFQASRGDLLVWSNRPGAIPLFLGEQPEPDPDAWRSFAAFGWFLSDAVPFRGIERPRRGSILLAVRGSLEVVDTRAIADLVHCGQDLDAGVEQFVAEASGIARSLGVLFPTRPKVDLSGGRDSRLAAAVFVAADVDASYVTSDMTPGEADVARSLFEALRGEYDHEVRWGGEKTKSYEKGIRQRALAVHAVHDGMRHASKVRGKQTLPFRPAKHAQVSGHGGEIGHGFYYTTPRALAVAERSEEDRIEKLLKAARRRHHGATAESYELARGLIERSLEMGEASGVEGANLLDWFYLTERFAHRSGVAADVQRFTFFSCQGFIRAAFALRPEERLENLLHRRAGEALVAEWSEIPYFEARENRGLLAHIRRRKTRAEKRPMIWEGTDGDDVDGMIAARGPWTEMYDIARVDEIWAQARGGSPDAHFQDVFEGIVFREGFADHLSDLSRQVEGCTPLVAS